MTSEGVRSRQFCHVGQWSPPVQLQTGESPQGAPPELAPLALDPKILSRVVGARDALKKHLPSVYKGHVQDFWELVVRFQQSVAGVPGMSEYIPSPDYVGAPVHRPGGECARLYPCTRPDSSRLQEESTAGGETTESDTDEYGGLVPPSVVMKVHQPVRHVYTGTRKTGVAKEAVEYLSGTKHSGQAAADYEVTYDMMKSGGMAVFVASEDVDMKSSNFYFKIQLRQSPLQLSPPLVLCEMIDVHNEISKTLTWLYYGVDKYSNKKEMTMTSKKAAHRSAFLKPSAAHRNDCKQISKPWDHKDCEKPVLSWEPEVAEHYSEPKTCIPEKQFQQLRMVLLARSIAQREQHESGSTEHALSDDSASDGDPDEMEDSD